MKKLLSTTLTLLLVIGLGTSTLKAEEKTEPMHNANTGVIVTFEDKIDVIDPDNPTDPDKDKEVDPGSDSAIQIWKVPEKLKFIAKRSNKNQVVGLAEGADPTYGVFDFHSESPDWKLLAQLSELTAPLQEGEKNPDNLKGASLQWTGDNIQRVTIDSDNERVVGVVGEEEGIIDRERVELAVASLGKTTVMSTLGLELENKGHYEGTMEDLGLVIPAFQGNPNTTYTGTITWTLQSPVFAKGE